MFSRRQLLAWTLALTVVAIPYIGLMVMGSYFLWEKGWFWIYGAITAIVTGLFYLAVQFFREKAQKEQSPLPINRPLGWPPPEREAWHKVQGFVERIRKGEITANNLEDLERILFQLVEIVAEHYHPNTPEAYLEVPLTDLLKILEKVARELHDTVLTHVPASHLLTLRQWKNLHQLYGFAQWLNSTYRMVTLAVSPATSIWREIRSYLTGQTVRLTFEQAKQEILAFIVGRVGVYLIELYSGRVILDEDEFLRRTRELAQKEWSQAEKHPTSAAELPGTFVRALVVGQIKAGKSSLINALRGYWQAKTDVIPCTNDVTYYQLNPVRQGWQETEGATVPLPGGLILVDTPGYENDGADSPLQKLEAEIQAADLVMLVCSARQAARRPDRAFLESFHQFFVDHVDLKKPPLLLVCTFIDDLRPFTEWNPPYRWQGPTDSADLLPKERSIRQVVEVIRQDLDLPADVPVIPVCSHPDRPYNVKEALIPVLNTLWPEAQAVRQNRYIRKGLGKKGLALVLRQTVQAGGTLIKMLFRRAFASPER